jgi:hypothetical protein
MIRDLSSNSVFENSNNLWECHRSVHDQEMKVPVDDMINNILRKHSTVGDKLERKI